MNQATSNPIVRRALDVAQLDERTYLEIAHDPNATKEAAIIVILVAVANGIGNLGEGSPGLIAGIVSALLSWVVFSAVTWFVATNITGSPTTMISVEALMRTLGYARGPGLLAIFGSIWLVGWIFALVAGIWVLITSIFAIRTTLRLTWLRTLATALLAVIAVGILNLFVGLIFGIGMAVAF